MSAFDIVWFIGSVAFIIGLFFLERWWACKH